MLNLFNEPTGFRLARLELYNWGTFDGQIWPMTPECETAVLTGPNGSGKSTVVDALLTLLVEGRQRNYNMASGAGSTRERTERTYVRGQYSRTRGETAIEATANTLRRPESHSVLLAVFYDAALDRAVSLAQVLWISNADRVEKRHYVADCDLSIEQHFPQRHVSARDLPSGVQVFGNVFKDYIAAARKALGLGGRYKALDLFNETVAVKDIASLNTFVRDHMLDKGDPEGRVEALRSQYRDLNEAHDAIQRAARQLDILTPLVNAGHDYRQYSDRITRHEAARSLVPFYVADKARALLTDTINALHHRRDTHQSRLEVVDAEMVSLRRELQDVEIAIAQDSVGQRTREIEGRLPLLQSEIKALRRAASHYDDNARALDLPVYQHEGDFYDNRTRAEVMLLEMADAVQSLDVKRSDMQIEQRDLIQQEKELEKEISYLRDNLSNIPAQVARIREEICVALGTTPDDLSFVGELLKVRDDDVPWEGVLERLLHSFAQDLIVPEGLYSQVSRYVNENHLAGRLVYRRVNPARQPDRLSPRSDQSVAGALAYEKLEIKRDTPYHDWLAERLMQYFGYVCCESLADFQQAERAITPQGQIKHSASRHEKDDRRDLLDRRHYVLGWDNRAKLRQLETELNDLHRLLRNLQDNLAQIEGELARKRRDQTSLDNLLKVETFAEIDWHTRQTEYDRLQRQLAELQEQSHQLVCLERQRDELRRQINDAQLRRDEVNRAITTIDNQTAGYQRELVTTEQQLAALTENDLELWEQVGDVLEEVGKAQVTLEQLSVWPDRLQNSIQSSVNTLRGYQTRAINIVEGIMKDFQREYPDEGVALTTDINALEAFERIHHRLESDDLPRYEERFKQMLDRTVTRGVMAFYSSLTEQENDIRRSIDELNDSLAKVDYGGGSIIRLIAEATSDPEIRDFERDLKACIPNVGDNSPEEMERAYNRIAALIGRFDDDPGWMRRVIDVRRWREFAAEQIDAQGRQVDYYSDSSGKSGGQKAKLAYTILASAIAYQYGLQDATSGGRSFRLVVIDEAFSKLDDDNARFAMQLFRQLGLQLLVVTPMQQLHVIEDYVKAYHVVVNSDEGSYSRLFNLTQAEYRERRREFKTQGQTA
jgi:uncharacterized protein YPO0396